MEKKSTRHRPMLHQLQCWWCDDMMQVGALDTTKPKKHQNIKSTQLLIVRLLLVVHCVRNSDKLRN